MTYHQAVVTSVKFTGESALATNKGWLCIACELDYVPWDIHEFGRNSFKIKPWDVSRCFACWSAWLTKKSKIPEENKNAWKPITIDVPDPVPRVQRKQVYISAHGIEKEQEACKNGVLVDQMQTPAYIDKVARRMAKREGMGRLRGILR